MSIIFRRFPAGARATSVRERRIAALGARKDKMLM